MAAGLLTDHVLVDALQGGAGTSTNMNVNEVLANRALAVAGRTRRATTHASHPLDDINLHQSTNDTYPTALRLAAIRAAAAAWRSRWSACRRPSRQPEKRFAHVVKVGAHRDAGRRAHHPGPRDGSLRRGVRPRPLAHLQVRRAAAGGQSGRDRGRHGPVRSAAVHLPRGRRPAAISPASASPGPRTWWRPPRTPTSSSRSPGIAEGLRSEPAQDLRRSAADVLRARSRPGRDPPAAEAGRARRSCRARSTRLSPKLSARRPCW